VFTARYGLSPYITQICFVFKELMLPAETDNRNKNASFPRYDAEAILKT
jgi:hypothetical protein